MFALDQNFQQKMLTEVFKICLISYQAIININQKSKFILINFSLSQLLLIFHVNPKHKMYLIFKKI